MADSRLLAILDRVGLAETNEPQEWLRHRQAVETAIDLTGKVNPKAAPKPSPQVLSWGPSSTTRFRAARAGTVVLLSVYATTAPTTGDATVTLTQTTQDGGTETLGIDLPAVISTDLRLNDPRFVKLPNLMMAKKKPIGSIDLSGVGAAASLKTLKVAEPPPRKAGVKLGSVAELVEKLKNEAGVL